MKNHFKKINLRVLFSDKSGSAWKQVSKPLFNTLVLYFTYIIHIHK